MALSDYLYLKNMYFVIWMPGSVQCFLYPNQQYSYVPIGDSKKRLNIQGDRLSEFLGSSINPITESTGLKRKIAAVERRAGIENAKFLGKMLQGMTDSRIHTTGDYDKVIHNLGKTQIGLTNELAEVKQKRTTYAAAAKHFADMQDLYACMDGYAAKPLNQRWNISINIVRNFEAPQCGSIPRKRGHRPIGRD